MFNLVCHRHQNVQGVLELFHEYAHGEFVKGGSYRVVDNFGKRLLASWMIKGFAKVSGLATGAVKSSSNQITVILGILQVTLNVSWWPNKNDADSEQSDSLIAQMSKTAQSNLVNYLNN